MITGQENTLDILLGKGDGTFANTSSGGASYAGVVPSIVDVEDFDGDGTLDIAVASHDGIGILKGLPDLAFQNPKQFPVAPFPYQVATAISMGTIVPTLQSPLPTESRCCSATPMERFRPPTLTMS